MDLENLPQKSKEIVDRVTNAVEETGKQVVDKVSNITEQKASEVTEEAIIAAVDQAIDVMRIAGQRVREQEILTEKVALEVSISILDLIELKMKTDVPKSERLEEVDLEVTES